MKKFGTTTRGRKKIKSGEKRQHSSKSLPPKFTSDKNKSVSTKDKPKQPKYRNGGNPIGRGGRPGGKTNNR